MMKHGAIALTALLLIAAAGASAQADYCRRGYDHYRYDYGARGRPGAYPAYYSGDYGRHGRHGATRHRGYYGSPYDYGGRYPHHVGRPYAPVSGRGGVSLSIRF